MVLEGLTGYRGRATFQGLESVTFRLEAEGLPTLFLKRREDPGEYQHLAVERFVLHRLIGCGLPTPRPMRYLRLEDTEYLMLSAMQGENLAESFEHKRIGRGGCVGVVADAVMRIHAATPAWPEDINSIHARIEHARERVRNRKVPADQLSEPYAGRTPHSLLDEFERRYREPAVKTFIHGDLCLPNLLAIDGALTGLVDWSRAGFGDPYHDLALAARSLEFNLGPGPWARELAQACGIDELDPERLELWQLFDELF